MKNCDNFIRRFNVKFKIENETGLQIILDNSVAFTLFLNMKYSIFLLVKQLNDHSLVKINDQGLENYQDLFLTTDAGHV